MCLSWFHWSQYKPYKRCLSWPPCRVDHVWSSETPLAPCTWQFLTHVTPACPGSCSRPDPVLPESKSRDFRECHVTHHLNKISSLPVAKRQHERVKTNWWSTSIHLVPILIYQHVLTSRNDIFRNKTILLSLPLPVGIRTVWWSLQCPDGWSRVPLDLLSP